MKSHIVIVGRARSDRENMTSLLVTSLVSQNIEHQRVDGAPFPENIPSNNTIVVYFSSKERFPSVLDECRHRNLPLIVGSSGILKGVDVPDDINIPVFIAANLSPLIMVLFRAMELLGKHTRKIGIRFDAAEGHQASKTSAPATGQKIVAYFGKPPESLASIRSDAIARAVLGIPVERLGGFGAHFFSMFHEGTNVNVTFSTQGRGMYLPGLFMLIEAIETAGVLQPGVQQAEEFIFPSHPLQLEIDKLKEELRVTREYAVDRAM